MASGMSKLIDFKVLRTDSGIKMEERNQETIFVVISSKFGVRIKAFDEEKKTLWEVSTTSLASRYSNKPRFIIGKKHAVSPPKLALNRVVEEGYFFDFLASNYPQHFQFFLWYPEARKGVWKDDS